LRLPAHYLAALFVLVLPILFTAATAALVALIALKLGASEKSAWWAAIGYWFGRVALCYARSFYAEPLLALLVTAALYAVFRGEFKDLLIAAALCALAVLAKPTGVVIGPILTFSLLCIPSSRQLRSFAPAAGSFVGLAVYALYNVFALEIRSPLDRLGPFISQLFPPPCLVYC
jgi:Gpi18-like mannosyltransferase